jgi:hyperosmotically inducible periplasmic protein
MQKRHILMSGLLAAVLAVGAGCSAHDGHRSTGQALDDTGTTSRVKAALVQNPVTKARDINVEVNRGVVQLAGFVDSAQEKDEASRVAKSVNGVQSVRNDLKVQPANRTAGEVVDDAMITGKVKAALIGDSRTKAYQINVETKEGIVELGGFVDTAAAKTAASEVARNVSGVKRVRNDLELK